MSQPPQYSDELDALEDDIAVLRTLVDAAIERRDSAKARALAEIIEERKTRLRRVMRDAIHEEEYSALR